VSAYLFHLFILLASAEEPLSKTKPALEELFKPRSVTRILEDYDAVTNSEWHDNSDFSFINGVLIRAPLRFARPKIVDYALYPKMSDAIKKMEYDPKTGILELEGEASGLRMHSWIKVDQRYYDEINYEIIRGDMKGFKVRAYLWEKNGKTVAAAKGVLPGGRKMFTAVTALLFKPVSEIVIGVATKNFRRYIEEEHKKGSRGK
jgi:hypothetical protein